MCGSRREKAWHAKPCHAIHILKVKRQIHGESPIMALVLNDDQQLLSQAVQGFLQSKSPVSALRKLRDSRSEHGFDPALWAQMAEQGFTGVLIPEEFGGSGFGITAAGLICEHIGRTLTSTPFLTSAVLAASALQKGGTNAQKAHYLPRLAKGALLMALACDEVARHNPRFVETTATPAGNGWVLSGRKSFVLEGARADVLIVAARTSGSNPSSKGISLFLVDAKAPGVTCVNHILVDSKHAADVHFADVPVAGDDLLGTLDDGFGLLDGVLDVGRVCLSAEMLGIAQESFERTVSYLQQREQFGVKIGAFQALQHRAAQLFCEIELGKSVVLKALQAQESGDIRAGALASLAKAKLGEVAKLATNEAVQMHGGIGMTDDFDIGFYMKRARAAAETFGDSAFHADRMARFAGY
jgi:alkylation response protein AidB-like acyl-CoA dehydrogenase